MLNKWPPTYPSSGAMLAVSDRLSVFMRCVSGTGFLFMRASLATHSTWYWPQTRSKRTNAVSTVPIHRIFGNAAGLFTCWFSLPCSVYGYLRVSAIWKFSEFPISRSS